MHVLGSPGNVNNPEVHPVCIIPPTVRSEVRSDTSAGENSRHKKQCLAHNLVPSTAPMPVSKRTRSLETPGTPPPRTPPHWLIQFLTYTITGLGHKTPCEVESGNALPFAPCVKVGLDCTSQAPKPPNRRCRIVSTAASLIPHQLTTLVEEDDESDRVKDETGTSPGLESWALGMYLVSRFEDLLAAEAADTEYADGQCEGDGLELLLDSRMDWAGSVAPFECVW